MHSDCFTYARNDWNWDFSTSPGVWEPEQISLNYDFFMLILVVLFSPFF